MENQKVVGGDVGMVALRRRHQPGKTPRMHEVVGVEDGDPSASSARSIHRLRAVDGPIFVHPEFAPPMAAAGFSNRNRGISRCHRRDTRHAIVGRARRRRR